MQENLQILILVILGAVLIWFGYVIFTDRRTKARRESAPADEPETVISRPDDPQTCPVCGSKLTQGELVKTQTFPSLTGGRERLMHIQGCTRCIDGGLERYCPVCYAFLDTGDRLIARMFSRPLSRTHVHIMGCSRCKPSGQPRQA